MFGRQAEFRRDTCNRLIRPAAKAMLPAAGCQGDSGRRTHGRIRVAVSKEQPFSGHSVEIGGMGISASIAAEVGIPEIVCKDEDKIRSREIISAFTVLVFFLLLHMNLASIDQAAR